MRVTVSLRAVIIILVTRTLTYLLIVREHARGGSMELTFDREGIPLATIFNAGYFSC